jgi:pretoxin HINT domain-containing protein
MKVSGRPRRAGASEATESGVSDVAGGVAEDEAAAAETAGSGVDNPRESARSGDDGPSAGREDGKSPCRSVPHSFAGSTPVLMADGSAKAIDEVEVGDKVADAVPGLAGTQVHTVDKVIVTTTDHDFVDVTVKPAAQASTGGGSEVSSRARALVGKAKTAVAAVALTAGVVAAGVGVSQVPADGGTLTTTYHHPFYDQTGNAFVDAKDLHAGDVLQTPTGTASVTAVRLYHATRTTYDLTIDGLHTYYVLAGTTPVLVHNCGGLDWTRAKVNEGGVNAVERHLSRFADGGSLEPAEQGMLNRLRSISSGDLEATPHDLRFYTHELRESVLYRKAGYPTGQPADDSYELWDQLHTQALKDYGLTRAGAPNDLYHPSVR